MLNRLIRFLLRNRHVAEFGGVALLCLSVLAHEEGAPKSSEWIQLQPPIRNPYFGAEMLDCGTEVKP